MTESLAALLAAHDGGKALRATIDETYDRIERHNDPALFIALRPRAEALAIAGRLVPTGDPRNRAGVSYCNGAGDTASFGVSTAGLAGDGTKRPSTCDALSHCAMPSFQTRSSGCNLPLSASSFRPAELTGPCCCPPLL